MRSKTRRVVEHQPSELVAATVWSDVTLRAMEGARGFPGFKKDPKAYFLYHLKKARDNKLTPPDWWHAARREEERRQSEFRRRSTDAA